MKRISFSLNGVKRNVTVDETRMLLWVLRDDLGLTGTKFGCGEAVCAACDGIRHEAADLDCAAVAKRQRWMAGGEEPIPGGRLTKRGS